MGELGAWLWLALAAGLLVQGCHDASQPTPSAEADAAATTASAPLDAGPTRSGPMDAALTGDADAARAEERPSPAADAAGTDAGPVRDSASPDAPDASDAGVVPSPSEGGVDGAATQTEFMLGADITWVQADETRGASYKDGRAQDILEILRSHGFNYIRLRLFVDPRATDGYDKQAGFGDLAHTIAFGKRIKAAKLGFLLDLHYSDNWADPGKQCVPVAWQKHATITQLATAVHDYTRDTIAQLSAAGARPDLVQLGNEITPGMLLHICNAEGQPLRDSPVQGSTSSWANLGALLRAGASAVREVDREIGIMLHIDRCGDKGAYTGGALEVSTRFITQARAQGVEFQYFGESCYQAYQGDPGSVSNTKLSWSKTLGTLAERFPDLRFIAAEYGPLQREVNDVVFALPGRRGAGSFVWEPTREGDWNRGHVLFSASGLEHTATADLSLYDQMRRDYARP